MRTLYVGIRLILPLGRSTLGIGSGSINFVSSLSAKADLTWGILIRRLRIRAHASSWTKVGFIFIDEKTVPRAKPPTAPPTSFRKFLLSILLSPPLVEVCLAYRALIAFAYSHPQRACRSPRA
jgi:hypothetical protein